MLVQVEGIYKNQPQGDVTGILPAWDMFQGFLVTIATRRPLLPGGSNRDLFIRDRWRSPINLERVTFSASQKGHKENCQVGMIGYFFH